MTDRVNDSQQFFSGKTIIALGPTEQPTGISKYVFDAIYDLT